MIRRLKKLLTRVIRQGHYGHIDFFLYPSLQMTFGGPFNGQRYRHYLFFELLHLLPITTLIETGTALGSTTDLFAATGLRVYSTELNSYYYCYSRMRFLFHRDEVRLNRGDSRAFLRTLAEKPERTAEPTFFYLDAHWNKDLPLAEELDIIFTHWEHPVVVIDDFKVPDMSYGYDDYGPGKTLDLEYVADAIATHSLSVFFPAVDIDQDTCRLRGCVLLCKENEAVTLENKSHSLRPYPERQSARALARV